jgi:DNA replication protein DnaC
MGTSELTVLHSPVEALAEARSRFGASLDVTELEPALGSVTLRPDQVETARRARSMLRREGGCLLAGDVGTGKTYVALALARS